MIPDAYLDALEVRPERIAWLEERFAQECVETFVAMDEELVGMTTVGPSRDEDRLGVRELYALYVLPSQWRQGAGSALLEVCGDVELLWVLAANARGRAFYERHGFRADGVAKERHFDGPVFEVRYVR